MKIQRVTFLLVAFVSIAACSQIEGIEEPLEEWESSENTPVFGTDAPIVLSEDFHEQVNKPFTEDLFPYSRIREMFSEQFESIGNNELVECVHAFPGYSGGLTPDELVVAQCYIVLVAIQEYAANNNGYYPYSLSAENQNGKTLVDYLPNGELLVNPINNSIRNPLYGTADGIRGAVGYQDLDYNIDGYADGYSIYGVGKDPIRYVVFLTSGQ